MSEDWTYIDGMKISVPQDRYDAIVYGWHCGVEFKRWLPSVSNPKEIEREASIDEWCRNTFAQNSYKKFYGGIYFYRERDAVLCQLRWA